MTGKTSIANYLSDVTENVTGDIRKTRGVRIVEFMVENTPGKGSNNSQVDVELWDCSGDPKYEQVWPVFIHDADGIIFVHANDEPDHKKSIETMYTYAMEQRSNLHKSCILFSHHMDNNDKKELKAVKSLIPQVSSYPVDVQENGSDLRKHFNNFISKVLANKE